MSRHAVNDATQSYLVEHYRPGFRVGGLRRWAARIRAVIDDLESEGKPVRFVRSTIVPADESLFCIFEAASEELVREAYGRAGIPFERISVVLPGTDETARAPSSDDRPGSAPRNERRER